MSNIVVLSMPRSGSSLLTNLIASAGYNTANTGPSEFNKSGYFEDTRLTLLNDQLIRLAYGQKYSFLHLPNFEKDRLPYSCFQYDIDESTLFIPENYDQKLKKYCGTDWDVWGLTRMVPGEKWYKCYSKFGVHNLSFIRQSIEEVNELNGMVIKDPRFFLTLQFFKFDYKPIVIYRKKESLLKSMRNHYGQNLFTKNFIDDTNWCSNHFNYKIGYQSFDDYIDRHYQYLYSLIRDKTTLFINYEKLLSKNPETIRSLNSFINGIVDTGIIHEQTYTDKLRSMARKPPYMKYLYPDIKEDKDSEI